MAKATTDEPKPTHTTFIVLRYDPPDWQTVLATTNKAEAEAVAKTLGKSGRIDTFTPRKKRKGERLL
jgi:hypothetical protein